MTTGTFCGGLPTIQLTVPAAAITALPVRAPIRVPEEMWLRLYVNGGKSWLGAKSVNWEKIFQPVLGPLNDANEGLALEYLDAAGTTATVEAIKSIRGDASWHHGSEHQRGKRILGGAVQRAGIRSSPRWSCATRSGNDPTTSQGERHRSPRMNDERGVALAMAIFALVIIGILVAGSFFAGRLEQQSGQNTLFAAQAAEAAEAGLSNALGTTQQRDDAQAIPIGTSSAGATVNLASGISYTPSVDRLTEAFSCTGRSGPARAPVQRWPPARWEPWCACCRRTLPVNAGLTALGDELVGGNSTVSGNDATPRYGPIAGVGCPTPANTTGVRYNGTILERRKLRHRWRSPTSAGPFAECQQHLRRNQFNAAQGDAHAHDHGQRQRAGPRVTGTPPSVTPPC